MTMKQRMLAVSAVGVVGLAGVGVAGVALADSGPTPTAAASPSTTAPAKPATGKHKGHPGRLDARHMLHGEFVTKEKAGYVTMDAQRGSVTAVSPTSVSLKSTDGFTATYAVGTGAKIRKNGAAATVAEVKVGDVATVVAVQSGGTVTVKGLVIGKGAGKADKSKNKTTSTPKPTD